MWCEFNHFKFTDRAIGIYNFQYGVLGNKKPICLHVVGTPNLDWSEESKICFWSMCNENLNAFYLQQNFSENLLTSSVSTIEENDFLKFNIYVGYKRFIDKF